MPKKRLLSIVVGMAMASCGNGGASQRSTPPLEPPEYVEGPCEFSVPFGQGPNISCGVLTVLESRSRPNGSTVRLAVAVLAARGGAKEPDPVVFLNGGPGASTTALLIQAFVPWFAAPVQGKRDIVLLDLRGTGLSQPSLACPEVDEASSAGLPRDQISAAIEACADRLTREGVDLSAYTSAASAADVRDLMAALGYSEWNLLGLSYGTRVALTAMRDDPDGIRSAALDSPVPLQAELALDAPRGLFEHGLGAVFSACRADPACDAAFPDVEEKFYRLVAGLDAAPLTVALPDHPQDPESPVRTRVIDGGGFLDLVQSAVFDFDRLRALPSVFARLSAGDPAALTEIVGEPFAPETMQQGAFFAVWCSEEAPFYQPELVDAAVAGLRPEVRSHARQSIELNLESCRRFGLGRPPAAEDRAVESAIPTLLMEGEFDARSSPSYSERTAATLATSYSFVFRGLGHAVLFAPASEIAALRTTCAMKLAGEFLEDPGQRPTGECVSELPPAAFRE